MDEIRVNTGDLRSGSQTLNESAGQIASAQSQVSTASSMAGNAYDGQLQQAVDGIVGGSFQVGARLGNRSIELANELLHRALGFEAANDASKSLMSTSCEQFTNFAGSSSLLNALALLSKSDIEKAIFLWGASGLGAGGLLSLITIMMNMHVFFGALKPSPLIPFGPTSSGVPPKLTPEEEKLWKEFKGSLDNPDAIVAILKYKSVAADVRDGKLYHSGNPVVDASVNKYTDQCTAYVAYRRPDISAAPNGKDWLAENKATHETGSEPRAGAIMVIDGTKAHPEGHVAYVERVNPDGTIVVSEQNWPKGSPPVIRTIDPRTRPIEGYIYQKK